MAWQNENVVGEGSDNEDDVESLRLQLQRVLHSIQEKNKIIKELWSKNNQYENDPQKFGYVDDTPHYPRELRRFSSRRRVQDEWQNNYNLKLDILKYKGSINVDDFIDWLNTLEMLGNLQQIRMEKMRRSSVPCGHATGNRPYGWPQPTVPAGGCPLRAIAPASDRPLQVVDSPLAGGLRCNRSPLQGGLAVASRPLVGGLGRSWLPLAGSHGQPLLIAVLAANALNDST
ncbi:hypothetical protein BHM03_00022935 [Ensete ventricosum]|nr:hypothetical protein BHM03_00022935 [Ensete ventricosum]